MHGPRKVISLLKRRNTVGKPRNKIEIEEGGMSETCEASLAGLDGVPRFIMLALEPGTHCVIPNTISSNVASVTVSLIFFSRERTRPRSSPRPNLKLSLSLLDVVCLFARPW